MNPLFCLNPGNPMFPVKLSYTIHSGIGSVSSVGTIYIPSPEHAPGVLREFETTGMTASGEVTL